MTRRFPLYGYVLATVAIAFASNVLLRVPLKIGGLPATLIAATLSAFALRGLFVWLERRPLQIAERWALAGLYGAALGAIYLLIFALMWLKDEPGDMGQLLFIFHYLCYPTALALVLHLGRRGG
ncbi:hypothetical protein [Aquipseudomonas alcaligenes]|uniref:Transmembrane protein n=1 Tax=Aquipseudomonas alcaligenes TaxID=43263 RepID=A0AA42N269_AQUAC|nr:hypothetical protein [Pseudomonas alcaligenes]MDH1055042.1 hypothetical protein [Pseudomonas alcaligenes]